MKLLTPEMVRQGIEDNKDWIRVSQSVKYSDYSVIRYTKKLFWSGVWNDFIEECRGLVIDRDYNIVARPFLKIYNYGIEKDAPVILPDTMVTAHRKINGYMLAVSFHNGEMIVSTTGSLDSEFCQWGREELKKRYPLFEIVQPNSDALQPMTYLFEHCTPADPHIIDEVPGLYFLGARDKNTGVLVTSHNDEFAHQYRFYSPSSRKVLFSEVQEEVKEVKHEGFVIYTDDGRATKIKSPYYLTKKMLMRRNMDKLLSMDESSLLDEEFYPLLKYIQETDKENYASLDEVYKRKYIENWFYNRN